MNLEALKNKVSVLWKEAKEQLEVNRQYLNYTPFDRVDSRSGRYQLFRAEMQSLLEELNEALVA